MRKSRFLVEGFPEMQVSLVIKNQKAIGFCSLVGWYQLLLMFWECLWLTIGVEEHQWYLIQNQAFWTSLHAVNVALVLLDVIVSAQPLFLLHFYQPLLFFYSYMSFTAIYYALGGTGKGGTSSIYPDLDWTKPERTLLIYLLPNTLWILFFHLFLWFLSMARTAVAWSTRKKRWW